MTRNDAHDERWMRVALSLAKRGLGQVAPNPAVGCVLVKEGKVVGRGWTQPGGRPHAEAMALSTAGDKASGASAYVTLEPCAHYGQTPPCAKALVEAGVSEVVVATTDPDPRVSGKGTEILRAAGIQVREGTLRQEADQSNASFFSRITVNRPLFTLKTATTLDGKIALANGESQWITGGRARQFAHRLRATHDAIMVGSGTVLADDPSLTCRLPGVDHRNPIKVLLDGANRVPVTAKILQGGEQVVVFNDKKDRSLKGPHDVMGVAKSLAENGITSVLIEGGGQVAASFLRANLVDKLEVFTAGKVIGAEGMAAIHDLSLVKLADAPHFKLRKIRQLGPDVLASYDKAE